MSCGNYNYGISGVNDGCGCQGTVQYAPPACNPNFPTTCTALGAGNIQRLVGEDSASCKYTVPTFSANSLLFYNASTGLINWADGSTNAPITLTNLQYNACTHFTGLTNNGTLAVSPNVVVDSSDFNIITPAQGGYFNVKCGSNTELSVQAGQINAEDNDIVNAASLTVNSNGIISIGDMYRTENRNNMFIVGYNTSRIGIYMQPAVDPATPIVFFNTAGQSVGSITTTSVSTAFNTSSDYRLKENAEPITDGLERISKLPVYRFNWKRTPDSPKVDGFFAHEAQEIVPESVIGERDAIDAGGNPVYQSIDQSKIVPLLVAAVKELKATVDQQAATIASLQDILTTKETTDQIVNEPTVNSEPEISTPIVEEVSNPETIDQIETQPVVELPITETTSQPETTNP